MSTFVELAVNVPQVSGVFDYHLPEALLYNVSPGHLVKVPFGQQVVHGIVLKLKSESPFPETRAVIELVDPLPVLTPAQLALAEHLSTSTLAPLAACIDIMLPSGLYEQAETLYSATAEISPVGHGLNPAQNQLYSLVQRRGPLLGRQIDRALPRTNWRNAARLLTKKGLLTTRSVLPSPIQPKYIRTVRLAAPPESVESAMPNLGRAGSDALRRRQAVLQHLKQTGSAVEVTWIYAETGSTPADIKALVERELVVVGEKETVRDPVDQIEFTVDQALALTSDQQMVFEEISKAIQAPDHERSPVPFLLHGVTGSGKTEIYLQAVDRTLAQNRQAVILVPEIALTPQTIQRFLSRFPGQVGLYHSGLSAGERYDTWRRARAGSIAMVVGPRSALFLPFPNLGLIVVDECHDESYYQSDPAPHYHTRTAAATYARLAGATCILGSATPDVTTVYQASQKRLVYLHLPNRIIGHQRAVAALIEREHLRKSNYLPLEGDAQTIDLPPVQIVDMRAELQAGNRSIFSQDLHAGISRVLENGEQAILFLNRRGTATYIFCRNCGYALKCPRCDLPLTFHLASKSGDLLCHHCGYSRKSPDTCPECHHKEIRHYGAGTEKVESEVQRLFPQARTLRWDYETTRLKGAHQVILSHFSSRRADILIGTQMLAKSLDLPLVTLVGLVLADVGLNLPDYRAPERAFQLMTQVAGRAGRSPLGGKVILQTFQPEHYVIQAAAGHNYRKFYQQELEFRRRIGYPPFSQLIRLEFRHHNPDQVKQAAMDTAQYLLSLIETQKFKNVSLIGPAPCFFSKIGGLFRWQIVLKGAAPLMLVQDIRRSDIKIEVNPPNLL